MRAPPLAFAHQLEAAKLNVANNAATPPQSVMDAIADADALIGNRVSPPIGTGYLSPASVSADVSALTNFNEGAVAGWPHCE